MTTALASAPALTALDRCDRCGAQAAVRATLETGDLLFCRHHARQHAEALARVAVSVDAPR
jgi:ribosomal protein S14